MIYDNEMTLAFSSNPKNEAFARTCAALFISQLDPTVSELNDIKTAVSEAVTNSVIHGYEQKEGMICLKCGIKENVVYIKVEDEGLGIQDIKKAMTPLYTSKPEMERSGMGFTVMETFMDSIDVKSEPGKGTSIMMSKKILHE